MKELIQTVRFMWYIHAKEAFYLAATAFWCYMTIMFYIPLLLTVK